MRRRPPMTPVDLAEDEVDGRGAPPARPPTGPGAEDDAEDDAEGDAEHRGAARRRRRAWALGTAVLAVATVTAVVGQGMVAARERERLASLTELPGALDPLDGPPVVLWSGTGDMLRSRLRTPEGLLVTVADGTDGTDGSATVRALDPATGATAWETVLLSPAQALAAPDGVQVAHLSRASCVEYVAAEEALVVCLVDNRAEFVREGARNVLEPTVTRLLLLDPSNGAVVDDLSDAVGEPLSSRTLAVAGDVLLLTEVDGPTARVRAVARDGTLVWQTSVPFHPSFSWVGAAATPVGDRLALLLPGEVRMLDASGATLRTVGLEPDDYVSEVTDDAVVVRRAPGGAALRHDGDTVSVATDVTTVVRADATLDVTGSHVSLSIDDGSVPDLVLTADPDGLHAWDQAGGARWTADVAGSVWHTTALAGRVHVSQGEEIVTLDATTGEELWRTGGLSRVVAHLTDGRYLVTLAPSSTPGGRDVVGIDPADGAIVWRTPLDAPVDTISSVFGVLVASDMQTARVTVLG